MPVGAELDRVARCLDVDDGAIDAGAVRVVERVGLAPDVGDVAFLEVDDAARHREQSGRVGGEEVVVVAESDDQRAPRPCADDAPRLARRQHGDRVGPVEFRGRRLHRAQQVAATRTVPVRMNQVRDHFGVGLRREDVALRLQPVAQRLVVLDDAVVHDGDLAAGHVRVRVHRRRRAVRSPAGVRDPGEAREPRRLGLRREVRDTRGADEPLELGRLRSADDRETGRIVAAILEPADAVDQHGNDVARGHRADDAAHGVSLSGASVS